MPQLAHCKPASHVLPLECVQVQKSWLYLEPIFSAQDIQKQLPGEYRAFDHVHKQLREIMRRTKDRPNALQTASNPGAPRLGSMRAASARARMCMHAA